MSRPVGNHIRAICTVLEEIGPATTRQIFEKTDGISVENVGKYASRAVGLGMASVQVGSRKPKDCNVYTVNPDWMAIAGQRRTTRLKPMPVDRPTKWRGVNSVFQMGAL